MRNKLHDPLLSRNRMCVCVYVCIERFTCQQNACHCDIDIFMSTETKSVYIYIYICVIWKDLRVNRKYVSVT